MALARGERALTLREIPADAAKTRELDTLKPILLAGLFLLGLMVPHLRRIEAAANGIPVVLALSSGLAFFGFRSRPLTRPIGSYMTWAFLLSAVAFLSTLASREGRHWVLTVSIVAWLALLVPGIGLLLTERVGRLAVGAGWLIGTSWYLAVVVVRVARSGSALDVNFGIAAGSLLGLNRNLIDLFVLWGMALAFAIPHSGLRRVFGVPFILSGYLWLATSGGRTALVSAVLAPLFLWFFARPLRERGPYMVLGALVAGMLVYGAVQIVGPHLPASDRLAVLGSSRLDAADEQRVLLARKAWNAGWKPPYLGAGFGAFEGLYDPVIEEATTPRIRDAALRRPAHNTFLEVLAAAGPVGLFVFTGGVLTPLTHLLRRRRSREVQALAAGFVVQLMAISFHSSLGLVLYLPLAMLLGAASEESRSSPDPAPSPEAFVRESA